MGIARNKRRVMVTIPESVAEQLERIRESTGTAVSGWIQEMLLASLPQLQSVADTMELARRSKDPETLRRGLDRLVSNAAAQLELLEHRVGDGAVKLPASSKKPGARRSRAPGTGARGRGKRGS